MTDDNTEIDKLSAKLAHVINGEGMHSSANALALVTCSLMRQMDYSNAKAYVEIFKSELLSMEHERDSKLGIKAH